MHAFRYSRHLIILLYCALVCLFAACSSGGTTSAPTPTPPPPTPSKPLGTMLLTYRGHTGAVFAVAWSPDGKRIASAGGDTTVQVWSATTGANVFTYKGHSDAVYTVAWSPDGKYIASGSWDKTVQVWKAP